MKCPEKARAQWQTVGWCLPWAGGRSKDLLGLSLAKPCGAVVQNWIVAMSAQLFKRQEKEKTKRCSVQVLNTWRIFTDSFLLLNCNLIFLQSDQHTMEDFHPMEFPETPNAPEWATEWPRQGPSHGQREECVPGDCLVQFPSMPVRSVSLMVLFKPLITSYISGLLS